MNPSTKGKLIIGGAAVAGAVGLYYWYENYYKKGGEEPTGIFDLGGGGAYTGAQLPEIPSAINIEIPPFPEIPKYDATPQAPGGGMPAGGGGIVNIYMPPPVEPPVLPPVEPPPVTPPVQPPPVTPPVTYGVKPGTLTADVLRYFRVTEPTIAKTVSPLTRAAGVVSQLPYVLGPVGALLSPIFAPITAYYGWKANVQPVSSALNKVISRIMPQAPAVQAAPTKVPQCPSGYYYNATKKQCVSTMQGR